MEIDLRAGRIRDLTTGDEVTTPPLPPIMRTIIADGGLVEHIKKHGPLKIE